MLQVVGESHCQDALWREVGGGPSGAPVEVEVIAFLVPETDNPYDPNAISVHVSDKVGFLPREDAARYRPGLLALQSKHGKPIALRAVIAGGGMRSDGPGMLGIFLKHDPTDFGLPAADHRRKGSGAYDGAAHDPIRTIPVLRKRLERQRKPVDRHFTSNELEEALYRSRDVFASALDEYDECCRQHDSEMDKIIPALVREFGSIPHLPIYKQMVIRQQKARDYTQGLWWAKRGLAVYGDNAHRPEDVEDLRKRAEDCRQRLESSA